MRTHVWLLVLLSACGPAMPDRAVEGRRVRYHHWPGDEPCAEAIAEIDAFVDGLSERLPTPLPVDFRIDYYKVKTQADVIAADPACSVARAEGCSVGSKVFTTRRVHDHEVAHAVLSRLGHPPAAFVEGMATIYGCGAARYAGSRLDVEAFDPRSWPAAASLTDYKTSASFLAWLSDQHDANSLWAFYAATPHDADNPRVEREFQKAFAVTLDDALGAWKASGVQLDGAFCRSFNDRCESADLPLDGGVATAEISCVDRVYGFALSSGAVIRARFNAELQGRVLTVHACDGDDVTPRALVHSWPGLGLSSTVDGRWSELLSPAGVGRYTATISRLDDLSPPGGTASVAIATEQLPLAAGCTAPGVTIAADTWQLVWQATGTELGDGGLVLLHASPPRNVVALLHNGFAQQPALCANSCGGACTRFTSSGDSIGPGGLAGPLVTLQESSSLLLTFTPDGGGYAGARLILDAP